VEHKRQAAQWDAELQRRRDAASRGALLARAGTAGGAGAPLAFSTSQEQRLRMEAATETLRGGTAVLADAQRQLDETLGVAAGVAAELAANRETIQRIQGKVRRTHDERACLLAACRLTILHASTRRRTCCGSLIAQ
jgi:hypothetical protein